MSATTDGTAPATGTSALAVALERFNQTRPRNAKLSEQVARMIVDDVFSSHLEPGTKLPPERVMLERFGVSRGTLREALRILEMHGLLTIRSGPTGGPVVADMTAQDFGRASSLHYKAAGATVGDLWNARLIIEPLVARAVAEALDDETEQELTAVLEASKRISLVNDADYFRIGSEFHRVIASMAPNPILAVFARSLAAIVAELVSETVVPADARVKVHADHQAIVAAILARDGARAEALMRNHMAEIVELHTAQYAGLLSQSVPYTA
jgi:DNA-binding FadR family transcriptional regulator